MLPEQRVLFSRPSGASIHFATVPTDESVGYFHSALGGRRMILALESHCQS